MNERIRMRSGYILVYRPQHPKAYANGRVYEHILVWEKANGQQVPAGHVIHHINGIKDDNRPENLLLLTVSAHTGLHNRKRRLSEETRKKISASQKLYYKTAKPSAYKDVDVKSMMNDLSAGMTKREVCKKYGIALTTMYRKIKEEQKKW